MALPFKTNFMKKLIKSSITCVMFAVVIYILLSCAGNNNKEETTKRENSTQKSNNSKFSPNEDTLKFDKLVDLLTFFGKKTDSFDRLRASLFTQNKLDKLVQKDSLQYLDSCYYGFITKRNVEILKFLDAHNKTAESLNGLKYLVVDWKTPIVIVDSIFQKFSLNLQNSAEGKWLYSKIKERKITETKPDFSPTVLEIKFDVSDGSQIKLKEISSKYILLDFWASWCMPCRHENRILKKLNESILKDVDVSIVAVSLDENKEKWVKAAKEDGLNYITICDYKALESPIAKAFGVKTVPHNVLISKDGKILGANLWGDQLVEFIKTLK